MASEKPFKSLEEFTEGKIGGFALIKQAKENPDILVKDIAIMADEESGRSGSPFLKNYDFDTFKREVVDPIRFLQEHGFEKFIPAIQPVWGKDENGEENGFLVMKRVRGVDIEDLEEISPRIASELDIFISKYFGVTLGAMISGGDIISPDISQSTGSGLALCNIMIGKVPGDKKKHVYLIDLYPTKTKKIYYQRIGLEKEKLDWFALLDNLSAKTGGKHDFSLSRAALEKYLSVLEKWQRQET